MVGTEVALGPFSGGMRNSSGMGDNIKDDEVFDLVNLEVDIDGTLVNRPAIRELTITGIAGSLAGMRVLGRYLPDNGDIYIVVSVAGTVRLIDALSGAAPAVTATVVSVAVIQYNNRLYVIPAPGAAGDGGYFDQSLTWTADADIPNGECAVLYKERIFVGAGITSTSNTSRFWFSAIADPGTWGGSDFVDVSKGDGEKLVDMLVLGNDILIFKEHSTWRFGYTKLPASADLSRLDGSIGVPSTGCVVLYNSNLVYVMHDNSVYEFFNSTYTRISAPVAMNQSIDPDIYAADTYGLSLFRDRLFVRYYSNLYVYSLRPERWAKWVTARKFSKIVTVPTASVGLDTAYMHSATSADPGKIFFFRDDRIEEVGTGESFTCSLVTKTYQFDIPHKFKAMFWGGIEIATSATLTAEIFIPNSTQNPTWDFEAANDVWDDPGNWDEQDTMIYTENIAPALGDYARKFLKCFKDKIRFRQVYFTISTPAVANAVADTSVKIFGITAMIKEAQVVTKETN